MKHKKVATLVCSALALTACTKALLWKTTITGADLTGAPLSVTTDASNATYQLYPVANALQLRKLDSKGVLLWSVPVDADVADSSGPSAMKATSTGVVVGYGTGTTQAYVRAFDSEGVSLWSSDLGTHTAEAIDALVVGSDDSVTLTIKQAAGKVNTLHLDAAGVIAWDKVMPNCTLSLYCASALALNSTGQVVETLAEVSLTKTYLIDTNGTTLWTKSHNTGVSTLGIAANQITVTANGYVVTHPMSTWEFDSAGNQLWTTAFGSYANVAQDGTGNLYVANTGKISKLDSAGTLISELALDKNTVTQMEWREDLQRLIVLSQYADTDTSVSGVITLKSQPVLRFFDNTGFQAAKLNGVMSTTSGSACTPFPSCTTVTVVIGDQWTNFASTTNKMAVVSGMVQGTSRYAAAYNIN